MLEYLKNKKFIGDLSLEDADVLAKVSLKAQNILEFGVGGSTQLFMQSGTKYLVSVDTHPEWIDVTKERLKQISSNTNITFLNYNDAIPNISYNVIFVDGFDHCNENLRLNFAIRTWSLLSNNGIMLFHDTRVKHHAANVLDLIKEFHDEVDHADFNIKASNGVSSNISIVYKKIKEPYVNWNYNENKPDWAYGRMGHDPSFPLWEYNETNN